MAWLILIMWGLIAVPAAAQRFQSEVEIIRAMPKEIVTTIAGSGKPDHRGLVGRNRDQWLHAALQRGGMWYLAVVSAYNDRQRSEKAWKAVRVVFEKQRPDGSFATGTFEGKRPNLGDNASGMAFFLGSLCHALLVVEQSPLASQFHERIVLLEPDLQRAIDWLAKHEDILRRVDRFAPNRLLFDARAFFLCGKLLGDEELKVIGQHFRHEGLSYLQSNGVFLEKGGYDSSYQGTALLHLEIYNLYAEEDLQQPIQSAANWLMLRITEEGEILAEGNTRTGLGQETYLGKPKGINYGEVVLALTYYAMISKNQKALEVATRTFHYAATMMRHR